MSSIDRSFGDMGSRGSLRIIGTMMAVFGCVSALFHSPESHGQDSGPKMIYHFRLTQGHGTPVCDAFERNLNSARYSRPPYCGIPGGDSISGFGNLKKVPLTSQEVDQLWPHLVWFNLNQNQFFRDKNFADDYPSPLALKIYGTEVFAWKYDSPVSMNNDGNRDNVLIWQGYGVDRGPADGSCGEPVPAGPRYVPYEAAQFGYILTPDNREIDAADTRAIFGNPNAESAPAPYDARGDQQFIFEYHERFYLAALFRRSEVPSPDLLRVFLREKRITREVCDYHIAVTHAVNRKSSSGSHAQG